MKTKQDIIDVLVGADLPQRQRRPISREQIQKSWEALFEPLDAGSFSLQDRYALALFISLLHQNTNAIQFYRNGLAKLSPHLVSVIEQLGDEAATSGPYGTYPDGPLTVENKEGKIWQPNLESAKILGNALSVALTHTHMLVFHPRDAKKSDVEALALAGWNVNDIVSLSQLVSFLTFQIRLVVGLQTLKQIQPV